MEFEATLNGEDHDFHVIYKLATQIEDNGTETKYVDWWRVTEVDGVKDRAACFEADKGLSAEDVENRILEWEA